MPLSPTSKNSCGKALANIMTFTNRAKSVRLFFGPGFLYSSYLQYFIFSTFLDTEII